MGIFYSVNIILNTKYGNNNIDYLFQQCLENNIRLYSDAFYDICELDSSDATARIFAAVENENHYVREKFQDVEKRVH